MRFRGGLTISSIAHRMFYILLTCPRIAVETGAHPAGQLTGSAKAAPGAVTAACYDN